MSPFKQILNFVMFIASVAYQQRLYKKMRERMEAEAEKRKGFLLPVRGQAVSLPVVYGKQKIAGVQTVHRVIDTLASVGNFTTVGYLDSGINDDTGAAQGVLPIISLRDGESNPEVVYNANGVVDSSNTDQFHHAQEFNSATNTFSTFGSKNSYLLMQQAISQGGINKVKHIFVDENDYNSVDAKFDHKILVYRTGTIKDDLAVSNGIPDTNIFTDCSYSSMIFKLNRDEPNYNGIPDVQFLVEGRKIRDINRSGSVGNYTYTISNTYSYSNNPALVLLDYLTNDKFGRGLNPSTEIDLESFYNSKEICARTDMVYENGVATTKSIPNAGFVNTVGQPTERTQSLSLDISGAFTTGNNGSVTVLMNASQINGNGLQGLTTDVGVVLGTNVLSFVHKSRISFGSGKSSGGVFKNALVKAVVTGTSDGTTPLVSEAVFMPKNTSEESKEKNYAYTNESFKTVTSITFTRIDNGSTDISTENLCIGTSRNVDLPALYECNITLDTSDTIRNNIEKILNTMGLAELSWTTEGKYKLLLEYPQTSSELSNLSVATFTRENVIRDEVSISYNAATERFNQVTATFSNEFEDFKDDSITFPRTNSTVHNNFLTEDNNLPMSSDIDLTGITNPYHALAKAEQIVRVSRRINTLNITLDKSALKLEPGDFITIDLVDALDTNGYADIDNEIYRVESIGVQEDLSVKVQAYKFLESDLAWNVADNLAYKNRIKHGFVVPPPSNLVFLKNNNTTAYNTSIGTNPPTLESSSGRLTWTAPNGVSKFVIEVARVLNSNYSGATDLTWIQNLNWITLGETKSPFFDVPSLGMSTDVTTTTYVMDHDSLRTFADSTDQSGGGPLGNAPLVYTPGGAGLNSGVVTSAMSSAGTLTFSYPTFITWKQVEYFSNGSQVGNSNNVRVFVSGTDESGNVLTNHPLQHVNVGVSGFTSQNDTQNVEPQFTASALTQNSGTSSDWNVNKSNSTNNGSFLCSTVAFMNITQIRITGDATVSGGFSSVWPPFSGISSPSLFGGMGLMSIGTIEKQVTTGVNTSDLGFSVRSLSSSGFSSSRTTTLGTVPANPTTVTVDPMIVKTAIIYANDSSGNGQSFASTGKTHRAIFNFTGTLGSLPISSYTLNGVTKTPEFDVIAGQDGARAIVIYADSANQASNSQSLTQGSFEFMAVVAWDDALYGTFPSNLSVNPIRSSTVTLTFSKIVGSAGVAGNNSGVVRVYYPQTASGDPSNGRSASASLTHFSNVTLNFTTMQLTNLPSDNHPTTGTSHQWSQFSPSIVADNTNSYWFVDLSFVGTGTSVNPVSATVCQRIIQFNNMVVFTNPNNPTVQAELDYYLGTTAANNPNATIISGDRIQTGSIDATYIDTTNLNVSGAINAGDLNVDRINGTTVASGNFGIGAGAFLDGALGASTVHIRPNNFSSFFGTLSGGSIGVGTTPLIAIGATIANNFGNTNTHSPMGGDGSNFTFTSQGVSHNTNTVASNNRSGPVIGSGLQYGGTYYGAESVTLTDNSFKVNSHTNPIVTIVLRGSRFVYHNGSNPFPNTNNLNELYGALAIKLNTTVIASCTTDLSSKGAMTSIGMYAPGDIYISIPGSALNNGTNTLKCFVYGTMKGQATSGGSTSRFEFYCDTIEFISLNS